MIYFYKDKKRIVTVDDKACNFLIQTYKRLLLAEIDPLFSQQYPEIYWCFDTQTILDFLDLYDPENNEVKKLYALLELQNNIETDAIAKMLTLEAIMYELDVGVDFIDKFYNANKSSEPSEHIRDMLSDAVETLNYRMSVLNLRKVVFKNRSKRNEFCITKFLPDNE